MTIKEMEQFSIKELESFSISELGSTPQQLVESISTSDSEISYKAYGKLCELCEKVSTTSEHKIKQPSMNVKDVLDCIYKLILIALHAPELRELIVKGLDSLSHLLS